MIKKPTKTEIQKLIKACALNKLANLQNTPINIQERIYKNYRTILEKMCVKYPHIDFQTNIDSFIDNYLRDHPFSGPGKDW